LTTKFAIPTFNAAQLSNYFLLHALLIQVQLQLPTARGQQNFICLKY